MNRDEPPEKRCPECGSGDLTYETRTRTYWCVVCGVGTSYMAFIEDVTAEKCPECDGPMDILEDGSTSHRSRFRSDCSIRRNEQAKDRRAALRVIQGGRP